MIKPGRKYGLGKYGRNTYDLWRFEEIWVAKGCCDLPTNWIPEVPPVEIWVPEPAVLGYNYNG